MHKLASVIDQRQQVRVCVNLMGVADFPTTKASLRVIDLSLGGARVELPMHVSLYDIRQVQALTIAGCLYAKVAWRWSRDRQAGLEFLAPALARSSVTELMREAQG
ncbi:PilZ domain-containing protein [Pseudooceanicola sp. MF1-13]|uniref:PilZ domain-containing protein n=1 Tax=Pseudooceanicola sp. MF1-13 TaxID=3379095 RepID=UPI0038928B91